MFEYIEKLRQKTDKEKRRIALFVSVIFSSTIFIIWITVVLPDIGAQKNNAPKSNIASPISNFTDMVSDTVNKMRETIGNIKDVVSSVGTSTTYYVSTSSTQSTSTYVWQGNDIENTVQTGRSIPQNGVENPLE